MSKGKLKISSGCLLMYMIVFTIYLYILYIITIYTMNNIIRWNCRGLHTNFTDFRLLCDNYNPLVCCLQETMLTKDDFIIRGLFVFI